MSLEQDKCTSELDYYYGLGISTGLKQGSEYLSKESLELFRTGKDDEAVKMRNLSKQLLVLSEEQDKTIRQIYKPASKDLEENND